MDNIDEKTLEELSKRMFYGTEGWDEIPDPPEDNHDEELKKEIETLRAEVKELTDFIRDQLDDKEKADQVTSLSEAFIAETEKIHRAVKGKTGAAADKIYKGLFHGVKSAINRVRDAKDKLKSSIKNKVFSVVNSVIDIPVSLLGRQIEKLQSYQDGLEGMKLGQTREAELRIEIQPEEQAEKEVKKTPPPVTEEAKGKEQPKMQEQEQEPQQGSFQDALTEYCVAYAKHYADVMKSHKKEGEPWLPEDDNTLIDALYKDLKTADLVDAKAIGKALAAVSETPALEKRAEYATQYATLRIGRVEATGKTQQVEKSKEMQR